MHAVDGNAMAQIAAAADVEGTADESGSTLIVLSARQHSTPNDGV